MEIVVGWATRTQPITRTITAPDHVKCIQTILAIEARQPWNIEQQRYEGKRIKWEVVTDEPCED